MKRTLVWCVVGLLSLMVAAQAKDKEMGGGTEQAVAALEQKWIDAAKTALGVVAALRLASSQPFIERTPPSFHLLSTP